MTITLTPAQHAVLAYAIHHNAGRIDWFPATIRGGARKKVLDGLASRGLAGSAGTGWLVSDAGYNALGGEFRSRRCEPATAQAVTEAPAPQTEPTARAHSKQATIIAMLRRPEGTTINEVMASTGWQAHTVRGTFAGAFKKKLGLHIVSDKSRGAERIYRIAERRS